MAVNLFQQHLLQVRHRLRRDHGIEGGIPVVFSLEKPKAKLLPFKGPSGNEENPSDYQVRMFTFYFALISTLSQNKSNFDYLHVF